jgi:hypothetical protein
MKGDDIAERLLEFGVAVLKITTDLSGLLRDATELPAILAASAKTARTASK